VPDKLRQDLEKNNVSILAAESEQRISLWTLKETQSLHFPQVDFTTGYSYARNRSGAGLILLNRTNGYNYGLSFRWNLFDGLNVSRQIHNARLNYSSTGLQLTDVKYQQSTVLENAIRNFQNNLDILKLETDNITLARENLDIALERFRSGLSTSLELREAQKSFEDAEVRLVQVQYAAKQSETELMRLNGQLVK
jgi:outer membrane protein TolC